MEAERAANKYKQVEYMREYVGEEFEAVISGVSSFGFWAETVAHKCEGMVSMTDLSTIDNFELIEHEYAIIGRATGIRFAMGDKVKVRVDSANLEKRQIDFSLVEMPQGNGSIARPPKKQASKGQKFHQPAKGHKAAKPKRKK
jgi:ribonuclease R